MEKIEGQKSLYDIVTELALTADRTNMFTEVEKFNSGERKITLAEYEFLGAVSYLHGLQFVNQRGSFKQETMKNFHMRMKATNIDFEFLERFRNFMEAVSVGVIDEGFELSKSAILSNAILTDEAKEVINFNFNEIIVYSSFDVKISEQIYQLASLHEFTYSDLLMINKVIFENLNFVADAFEHIDQIWNNEEFKAQIAIASNYFDLTKFGVVYVDEILTLKEWYDANPLLSADYIDVDVENIIDVFEDVSENKQQGKKKERPTVEPVAHTETDKFARAILIESSPTSELNKIENSDDLFEAVTQAHDNQDIIAGFYQFIVANQKNNRTEDLSTVYGFDVSPFIATVKTKYDGLRAQLRKVSAEFLDEIEPEKLDTIVGYLNGAISSVIIDTKEKKAYFQQQLESNQIATINHLYQMLGLLETGDILGNGYKNYVFLLNYVEQSAPEIKTAFDNIEGIEDLKISVNFYKAVYEFFSKTEPTK